MIVAQSCLTLCDPTDCSLPGFYVHGILQSRILEWAAIPFSRGSSQPRNQTWVSCVACRFFTVWATGKFTGPQLHTTPVSPQPFFCPSIFRQCPTSRLSVSLAQMAAGGPTLTRHHVFISEADERKNEGQKGPFSCVCSKQPPQSPHNCFAHFQSDYKESRMQKNWCFWTVVLEKTPESPLDCKEMEISPECSLEGLMLKLKLQYFGHLMWRADSFEKTLMLGKIEGRKTGNDRGWDGWMASPTQWTWVWVNSRSWWWTGRPGMLQSMGHKELDTTEQLNDWTELKYKK